jgi:3'-5' exonuclease
MTKLNSLTQTLFLDIETVPGESVLEMLSEEMIELWSKKASSIAKKNTEDMDEAELADLYEKKAAIFSEFGRIVCISVGVLIQEPAGEYSVRLKSFCGEDEKFILEEFSKLVLSRYSLPEKHSFCGHNLREFDIPYICRRMVINQLPIPDILNVSGKKPWEVKYFLDTLEMWRFGDSKNFTSLRLLAGVLGIPSPKDDIDGSQVGRVFYEEGDYTRIAKYCEKDVLTCIQVLLRLRNENLLRPEQVTFVGMS